MTHIESRPSKTNPGVEYDFYVDCVSTDEQKQLLLEKLNPISCKVVNVLSRAPSNDEGEVLVL